VASYRGLPLRQLSSLGRCNPHRRRRPLFKISPMPSQHRFRFHAFSTARILILVPAQGLGHSQMLARVRVVPREEFHPDNQGRVDCGSL
jgi:hypothetical protein